MPEPTEDRLALGERLKIAREMAGLSQGQVAKMLDLHRPTISEIEAGRRKVSVEELKEFARIYRISIDWIMANDSKESIKDSKIELAARELSKLNPEDVEKLLELLSMLRSKEDQQ